MRLSAPSICVRAKLGAFPEEPDRLYRRNMGAGKGDRFANLRHHEFSRHPPGRIQWEMGFVPRILKEPALDTNRTPRRENFAPAHALHSIRILANPDDIALLVLGLDENA